MGNYLNESFRHRKSEVIFYGTVFIQSEGGYNWENVWKGSDLSLKEPNWLQFYYVSCPEIG